MVGHYSSGKQRGYFFVRPSSLRDARQLSCGFLLALLLHLFENRSASREGSR